MTKPNREEQAKIIEIGELTSFLQSQSIRRLLQERRIYLQKRVNEFVDAKDLYSAYGELCKLKDIGMMMDRFQNRLEKLRKEK